jgi:hypothetical protein
MFGRHFSFVSEIHTVVGRLISCECAGLKLMLLSAFYVLFSLSGLCFGTNGVWVIMALWCLTLSAVQ